MTEDYASHNVTDKEKNVVTGKATDFSFQYNFDAEYIRICLKNNQGMSA